MADLPLSLLCNELTSRGNDGRPALATLDPLTLFYRTAGETPASFHRGTEVKATVTRLQGDQRALLRLDNGLPGYLDRADFPAGDALGAALGPAVLGQDFWACRTLVPMKVGAFLGASPARTARAALGVKGSDRGFTCA